LGIIHEFVDTGIHTSSAVSIVNKKSSLPANMVGARGRGHLSHELEINSIVSSCFSNGVITGDRGYEQWMRAKAGRKRVDSGSPPGRF